MVGTNLERCESSRHGRMDGAEAELVHAEFLREGHHPLSIREESRIYSVTEDGTR
jgi:hypothetical protein